MKKSRIFPAAFSLALLVVTLGCGAGSAPRGETTAPVPPRDGVFIHISHGTGDPHRVLMALKMAELMAADKDVLVYFDIEGIEVVLADAPDIEYAQFPASRTQIVRLLDLGVPILACPGCLQAAGKTAADLTPGIQAAEKDAFFQFTEGRILTLDY